VVVEEIVRGRIDRVPPVRVLLGDDGGRRGVSSFG
jgi:hypothetical protein